MPDEQRSSISRVVAAATSSGSHHFAARVHALEDAARVGQRGQRIGLLHIDPAEQGTGRPRLGEMQRVLEACGDQQADTGALAFQNGVGRRNSGAVQNQMEIGWRNSRLSRRSGVTPAATPIDWSSGRRRCFFGLIGSSRLLIMQQQIGERAADIDSKPHISIPQTHRRSPRAASPKADVACAFNRQHSISHVRGPSARAKITWVL